MPQSLREMHAAWQNRRGLAAREFMLVDSLPGFD
jgi:hypothetical protein